VRLSFGIGNIPSTSNLAKDLLITKTNHQHERAGFSQQHDQGLRKDDFKHMNISELRRIIQTNGIKIKLDSSHEEMEKALCKHSKANPCLVSPSLHSLNRLETQKIFEKRRGTQNKEGAGASALSKI